jgi:mono/diheme cytochrome c family protein
MLRVGSIVWSVLAAALAADEAPRTPAVQPSPRELGTAQRPDGGVQAVSGAYTFRTYCATCHGANGKGDGPLAQSLRFHPPDLTLITSRHGGEYPAEEIRRIVDGRKPLSGHGGPEMPVWGDAFRNAETGYDEWTVKERIRSVVEYVRTLQVAARK